MAWHRAPPVGRSFALRNEGKALSVTLEATRYGLGYVLYLIPVELSPQYRHWSLTQHNIPDKRSPQLGFLVSSKMHMAQTQHGGTLCQPLYYRLINDARLQRMIFAWIVSTHSGWHSDRP